MSEQPDPRPVYEYDQVVTIYDLIAIRNGYALRYNHTVWYQFKKRWMLRVGLSLCDEMLHWMYHGKPLGGINCTQGKNHDEKS